MGYPAAAAYAANFIMELCGGDHSAPAELDHLLGYDPDPDPRMLRAVLEEIIRDRDLPFSSVVQEDIDRVCSNQPPLAFASEREYADQYRAARGISLSDRGDSAHSMGLGGVAVSLWQEIEAAEVERRRNGVTLGLYRSGVACGREQRAFYRSAEWSLRARALRAMAGHKCEQCSSRDEELHAHHLYPIYSAFSGLFLRNFDACRMQALCRRCHDRYHRDRVKRPWGFELATKAEKVAARDRTRRMMALHDEKKECAWCSSFVWSTAGGASDVSGTQAEGSSASTRRTP